jgi:hypothetical protein
MLVSAFISIALLGLSGVLIDSHRRGWRLARDSEDISESDRRYARAQYRRRMQASGIIGCLGAVIALGPLVPKEPGPMVFYLATLVSACGCILLLAMLDAWATRQHYRRLIGERVTAELRLAAELQRARERADANDWTEISLSRCESSELNHDR